MSATVASNLKAKSGSSPAWLLKILKRHNVLNVRYEKAQERLAVAYAEFISNIDDVNLEYGTEFTAPQAVKAFDGVVTAADLEIEDDDEE